MKFDVNDIIYGKTKYTTVQINVRFISLVIYKLKINAEQMKNILSFLPNDIFA